MTTTVKIYKTASSVNEGSTATFYATGFTTEKTFNYTLAGTTSTGANFTALDVKGGLTGVVPVSNGVAVIPVTLLADLTTEGTDTMIVSGTAAFANADATTASITVYDTSTNSPSKIIPSAATVNEGSTVTFNINAANGAYTYTFSGPTITTDYTVTTSANVVGTLATGTVTVVNGVASIPVVVKADAFTESTEVLTLTLSNPTLGGVLPSTPTATVTIIDTSITATNTLTPSVASVNEGGGMMFNFANAVKGSYTAVLSSTGLAANDAKINNTALTVSSGVQTNTISVTVGDNGLANIPVSFVNDVLAEGPETFTLTLAGIASTSTAAVSVISTVIVNDTSTDIPTLSPAATSVNEGGSAVFTLSNMPVGSSTGTTYAYTLTGITVVGPALVGTNATHASVTPATTPVTVLGDTSSLSGTFTIASGKTSGTVTVPLNADHVTELGGEMLIMTMTAAAGTATGTGGGTPTTMTAIDAAVLVNDSSKDYAYSLNPSTQAVNEGGAVLFSITDGKPGQTVGYKVVTPSVLGTYTAADLNDFTVTQGGATLGSLLLLKGGSGVANNAFVTIGTDGKASFSVYVSADTAYDGGGTGATGVKLAEKFAVQLFDVTVASAAVTVVGSDIAIVGSSTVIINDTSFV